MGLKRLLGAMLLSRVAGRSDARGGVKSAAPLAILRNGPSDGLAGKAGLSDVDAIDIEG